MLAGVRILDVLGFAASTCKQEGRQQPRLTTSMLPGDALGGAVEGDAVHRLEGISTTESTPPDASRAGTATATPRWPYSPRSETSTLRIDGLDPPSARSTRAAAAARATGPGVRPARAAAARRNATAESRSTGTPPTQALSRGMTIWSGAGQGRAPRPRLAPPASPWQAAGSRRRRRPPGHSPARAPSPYPCGRPLRSRSRRRRRHEEQPLPHDGGQRFAERAGACRRNARVGQLGRIGDDEGIERSRRGQGRRSFDLDVEAFDRTDWAMSRALPRARGSSGRRGPRAGPVLLGDAARERGGEIPRPQDHDGEHGGRILASARTRPAAGC